MKNFILTAFSIFCTQLLFSQGNLPDSCKLQFGTNIAGLSDYGSENPFVDIMKICRQWRTTNSTFVSGGTNPFDTQLIDSIPLDQNGYPLFMPVNVASAETSQSVATVWANTSSLPSGQYIVLYDGTGVLEFAFDASFVSETPGRIVVNVTPGVNDIMQLKIRQSDANDPIKNIRFLMPGTEFTYMNQPFRQAWLNRLAPFKTIRFMDWGSTNSWGHNSSSECFDSASDTILVPWSERREPSYYTYTTNKGAAYESMIDLCNRLNADMWICVPHCADTGYIGNMSRLVRNTLNSDLKVYVEYSNELWNFMFGQTQWLNTFYCTNAGVSWPEGIVPHIQRCMDVWTSNFSGQTNRLIRTVGVQAAWQDVSNRIVFNMQPGTFDAFAPAAYFNLSDQSDAALDALGASATAQNVLTLARQDMEQDAIPWLRSQKETIADSLHIPMLYYEGGQHLTPTPFGVNPSYANALTSAQRHPGMYDLYSDWFDTLRTLTDGSNPSMFMNFTLAAELSAQYGSWGILESIDQDTSLIKAPKFAAIMDNIFNCNGPVSVNDEILKTENYLVFPNPATDFFVIQASQAFSKAELFDAYGRKVKSKLAKDILTMQMETNDLASGIYHLKISTVQSFETFKIIVKGN